MRMIGAACLVAICGMLAGAPARADWVPPFKGNDTGGIIAYSVATQTDARQLAVDHCARYGKVVKFLAVEPHDGGYISFACRWVPYGANDAAAAHALLSGTVHARTDESSAGSASMTRQLLVICLALACWRCCRRATPARWNCRSARPACGK